MNNFRFVFYLSILSLFFFSCKPKVDYKTLEGTAQGTTFRITYQDNFDKEIAMQVDSLFKVIDSSMSLWDSTSLISKVNANKAYNALDYHFLKVFEASQKTSLSTDGYFDITVGPLVKAWGFSVKKNLPAPSDSHLDSLKNLIGFNKVSIQDRKLIKVNPNIQIDFNAIAQGYTVDVMAEFLESYNCHNYLIEIGGEVRGKGKNKEGNIWRVGIEKPQDERDIEVVVNLENKSLATSGSYRKFIEKNGQKFSHAINPKTGTPVTHNMLSVSIIASDCMTADAYATAFLVMGLDKSKAFAKKQKIDFFAIYEEVGIIKTFSSDGFKKYVADIN